MSAISYSSAVADTPLLGDTIGANLDATVARFGEREVLVDCPSGRRWTYAAFGAEVDELARAFLATGVRKGDRVGIWSPNCPEWVLVQYATAKIGAILVNINPAYRTNELQYALAQSACRTVTTTTATTRRSAPRSSRTCRPRRRAERAGWSGSAGIVYALRACSRRRHGPTHTARGGAMGGWDGKRAVFAVALALAAGGARAQTLEQDEARIEELMAAGTGASSQQAAPAGAATPAYDDSVKETPVVAAVVAPAPSANDEWLAAPTQDDSIPFAELRYHVGQRVLITTSNEREHNGIVTSADARQVTMEIRRKGGIATYVLKKEQILRIEPR